MNKKIRTAAVETLFNAIIKLETVDECFDFFEDLATINCQHKTYLEIAEKTGASTATISRVNRSLNYGNDGYDLAIQRIQDNQEE